MYVLYMYIFLYLQSCKEKKRLLREKKYHNYINSVRNYKQPGWNQSWLWISSAWSANYWPLVWIIHAHTYFFLIPWFSSLFISILICADKACLFAELQSCQVGMRYFDMTNKSSSKSFKASFSSFLKQLIYDSCHYPWSSLLLHCYWIVHRDPSMALIDDE